MRRLEEGEGGDDEIIENPYHPQLELLGKGTNDEDVQAECEEKKVLLNQTFYDIEASGKLTKSCAKSWRDEEVVTCYENNDDSEEESGGSGRQAMFAATSFTAVLVTLVSAFSL